MFACDNNKNSTVAKASLIDIAKGIVLVLVKGSNWYMVVKEIGIVNAEVLVNMFAISLGIELVTVIAIAKIIFIAIVRV